MVSAVLLGAIIGARVGGVPAALLLPQGHWGAKEDCIVGAGETVLFVLSWYPSHRQPSAAGSPNELLQLFQYYGGGELDRRY